MSPPLDFATRRALHFAKAGTVAARVRELCDLAVWTGESRDINATYFNLTRTQPALIVAYECEKGDVDVSRDDPTEEETDAMSAESEILKQARALVATGDAKDETEGISKVFKQHPALYQAYASEARARARTAALGKGSVDIPRRAHESQGGPNYRNTFTASPRTPDGPPRDGQALPVDGSRPTGAPPPAQSAGHMEFERLCAEQKRLHPQWSDRQCMDAVLATQQGVAAMAQNRAEVLAGRRG